MARITKTAKGAVVPIMSEYAPTHAVRFNGTFRRGSKFKGPPSKAVDEAWESIAPRMYEVWTEQAVLKLTGRFS